MRCVVVFVVACLAFVGVTSSAAAERNPCDRGEFCSWADSGFDGVVQRLDLTSLNPGECFPVAEARSFANRADRLVTVYQGADCSTEGEFTTYPGGGTYVPEAPFVVRGIEVWEH